MKKIKYLLILIILLPISVLGLTKPNLYSKAYVVYDSTDDKILFESNSKDVNYIASTTKMMSSIIIIENVENLDDKLTITQDMLNTVPWDAYKIGLKAGDEVSYRDLLYGTLLPSAADCVNSLAVQVAGSTTEFVNKMNAKATELGMKNTNFTNPIGMDDNKDVNHKSSAEDLLILLKYVLQNEEFKTIFETKTYTMSNGKELIASSKSFGDQIGLDTSRIVGGKTGFTDKAGFCLAYEFKEHDHVYYAVTLGAPVDNFKDFKHLRDANTVIDYVNQNYTYITLFKKDDVYNSIIVNDSTIDKYDIKYNEDLTLLLPVDFDKSKIKTVDNLPDSISYKNSYNEVLGTISYYYEDELIYQDTILLKEDINPSIIGLIKNNIVLSSIIITIVTILIIISMILLKNKLKRTKKVVK